MVYSAQERGRRGQGAPCPQHHPQLDLWRRWQTPLSTGKSLKNAASVVHVCISPYVCRVHPSLTHLLVCAYVQVST